MLNHVPLIKEVIEIINDIELRYISCFGRVEPIIELSVT